MEEKGVHLPESLVGFGVRVKNLLGKLEERLGALSKQQRNVLLATFGLLALLFGMSLGLVLSFARPIQPPKDSNNSSNGNTQPQVVSETGVLRMFREPQDGIEFYLEAESSGQILLDFGDRFDSSFLRTNYEGAAVTIEGEMRKVEDDSKPIISVDKILIKYR